MIDCVQKSLTALCHHGYLRASLMKILQVFRFLLPMSLKSNDVLEPDS